jgi:hypothetical protein
MSTSEHVIKVCNDARRLLDSGWNIFPISYDKRLPLDEWKKYQTEFVTQEDIDSWEDKGAPCKGGGTVKTFNIALVTGSISGIVVVDCDNTEADAYAKRNGLTSPFKVKTTRGYHYYFKHPGHGIELRNRVGSNPGADWFAVPGLDFRGDGGYVVSPPSVKVNDAGEVVHTYDYEWPEGLSSDDMPVWTPQGVSNEDPQEFSFATMDLSSNRIIDRNSVDVEEQVRLRVAHLGRKLMGPNKGDSTDNWMIKFCGQKVREGLLGQDLADAVQDFFNNYFIYDATPAETQRWLATKMRSAMEMDKRNHKTDYIDGERTTKDTPLSKDMALNNATKTFKGIYLDDLPRILSSLGETEYHADPILPAQSIVQVVGYNGHGKSYFLMSMLMAMAAGQERFGPYEFSQKRPKVLYMDFDNPGRTVGKRMQNFADMFGHTQTNFSLWSAGLIHPDDGGDINMNTEEGLEKLRRWVNDEKPNIIVIDTIRNAFGGFDENSAQDWFRVGHVAKLLRDCQFKCTVILVHHRNKPGDGGLGREAGSTAQMTNIDTQIMVTQVYENEELAKKKAGLFAGKCKVIMPEILNGAIASADEYLMQRAKLITPNPVRLRMISEISFGKVRQATELHDTHYIGYAEELDTGRSIHAQ